MKSNEISELALKSASKYYEYLFSKSGAVAKIPLKEIKQEADYWIFTLSKDLLYDEYDISIFGQIIDKSKFSIIKYDDEKRNLYVLFNVVFEFPLTIDKVHLETNLLFLIDNVKKWYENRNNLPKLPVVQPSVASFPTSKEYAPSVEQMSAVDNIKNQPLSYVWGAPGTGKTQFVLARCITDYIKMFQQENSKNKILVCAPTNNALEQVLFGVFKVLKAENISTDTVVRLGMPSKRFYNEYPGSCEQFSTQNSIRKKEEKISELNGVITKRKEIEEIAALQSIFDNYLLELKQFQIEENGLLSRKSKIQNEINDLEISLAEIRIIIHDKNTEYREFQKESRKIFNRIFKSKKSDLQYECDKLTVEIADLKNTETLKSQEIDYANNQLKETDKELLNLHNKDDIKNDLFRVLREYRHSKSEAIKNLLLYLRGKIDSQIEDFLNSAINKCCEIIKQNQSYIFSSSFGENDDLAIQKKIERLNTELEQLFNMGMESKIANANIVALTVDKFISKYKDFSDIQESIKHIFVDEAAYLSMIKGLTLFSLDMPITLLGDHMQLPPVFTGNRKLIDDNPDLCLWEMPIIYCEEIFLNDFDFFFENHFKQSLPPSFKYLSKINLNTTYRFSNNLADVLCGTVYSDEFHSGLSESYTQITAINAVSTAKDKQRISPWEVFAIRDYVELYSDKLESFAILTPYRNQVSELQKALPKNVDCMTIHSSQGQEWDAVIISIVDSFMSTDIKVINTAVSRTKKRLIIVCDVDEWKMHKKRLITKIVSIADEILNYDGNKSFTKQFNETK